MQNFWESTLKICIRVSENSICTFVSERPKRDFTDTEPKPKHRLFTEPKPKLNTETLV